MSEQLSGEELQRRLAEVDGKARTLLQLSAITLAILVFPATSDYFPNFARGVVAVTFLLVGLTSLRVLAIDWHADSSTLCRRTRTYALGRWLAGFGVVLLAVVPPLVQMYRYFTT